MINKFKIDDKNFKKVFEFLFMINKIRNEKENNDNKEIKTNDNPIEKLKRN